MTDATDIILDADSNVGDDEQESRYTTKDLQRLSKEFNRIVRWAQSAIFFERAWPKLVPALCVGGLFLSASWFGLWAAVPPEARIAGVLALGAACLVAPFLIKTGNLLVTKDEAIKRIDENTGDPTRPAQTISDKLSDLSIKKDQELWDIHLKNIWNKWAGKFTVRKPQPKVSRIDPFGIRYVILLSVLAGGLYAGDQRYEYIADAFDWATQAEQSAGLKLKAWVVPPDNIQKAPIYLSDGAGRQVDESKTMEVHKNSILSILIFGAQNKVPNKVRVNGVEIPVTKEIKTKNNGEAGNKTGNITYQYEIKLSTKDTSIQIENGPEWRFDVTPDKAPNVLLGSVKTKEGNKNALQIKCSVNDDFGIQEGRVVITVPGSDPKATPLSSGTIEPIPVPKDRLCI